MKEILERLHELTKQDFVKRQLYDELFSIKSKIDRSEAKFNILERAKDFKLLSYAKTMIAEMEKEEKKKMQEEARSRSLMTVENITNFYPDISEKSYSQMACGSWIATEDGIYSSESSQANKLACHHPIMPIKRLKNIETGKEQITLAFKRDGLWQELTVPKIEIVTARAITNLAEYGVQVNSENAKLLVRYLADVEMYNSDIIDIQHSTGKLGWHDRIFVPYDLKIIFDGDNRFRSLYASITEHGDYFKWISLVKQLRALKLLEPRLALAASFASVLIKPLEALPFIVDFYGQTGGGKTVTIELASSVWGNPDKGCYRTSFRASDVGLEARADMLNHLPLVIDDSKDASDYAKDNYENLVYNLCAGKGKSRSTKDLGAAREMTWSNTIITNGENPLAEYAESGGALNRIIEVECLEDIYKSPNAPEVKEIVLKNYGFAGRIFVAYIKKKTPEELKEMRKEIEKKFTGEDFMHKQLLAMSILLLADKLATEAIFMDGKALTVEDVKELTAKKETVTEGQRCYDYIMDCLSIYGQHFNAAEYGNLDQWGLPVEKDADGHLYAYFYIAPFEIMLKKQGFSRKAFTSWAMRRGLLKCNKGRDTITKKDNGKATKFIAVKIIEDEPEEELPNDGFMDINSVKGAQEILPFS